MKQRLLLCLMGLLTLLMTGCSTKEIITITIDDNQNVSMSGIVAIDNELIDSLISSSGDYPSGEAEDIEYSDEERWKWIEENWHEIFEAEQGDQSILENKEKYEDDIYKGYQYFRNLGTIDEVSTNQSYTSFNDSSLFDENKLFSKNGSEYVLLFETNSIESSIDSDKTKAKEITHGITIKLPRKAKYHNASVVSEDGLTYSWDYYEDKYVYLVYDPDFTQVEGETSSSTKEVWSNASDWATSELLKASEMNLIPESLFGIDFTQNITRKEYAHVAVKLYEALTNETPVLQKIEGYQNPFSDTDDEIIQIAYQLGITKGTSATTFSPNDSITREQMATMTFRLLLREQISTMTNILIKEAGVISESYEKELYYSFFDFDQFHDWGYSSIYYMSSLGFMKGVDDKRFGALENTTREQALIIAKRIVNEFEKMEFDDSKVKEAVSNYLTETYHQEFNVTEDYKWRALDEENDVLEYDYLVISIADNVWFTVDVIEFNGTYRIFKDFYVDSSELKEKLLDVEKYIMDHFPVSEDEVVTEAERTYFDFSYLCRTDVRLDGKFEDLIDEEFIRNIEEINDYYDKMIDEFEKDHSHYYFAVLTVHDSEGNYIIKDPFNEMFRVYSPDYNFAIIQDFLENKGFPKYN